MWKKSIAYGIFASKFLGLTKDSDNKTIVDNMLVCFEALGCRMSLKFHFLHAHLDTYTIFHKTWVTLVKNIVNIFTQTSKA